MLFKKEGLAGGKLEIDPEIPTSSYKGYTYTEEDARKQFKKYAITELETTCHVKLQNGILYIDEKVFDLGDKTLGELFVIFEQNGVKVNRYSDISEYESILYKLPAILLTNFNNVVSTNLGGRISPVALPATLNNRTVKTITNTFSDPFITTDKGVKKQFKEVNSNIFFEPSKTTLVYLTEKSTKFGIYLDFAPRRLESERAVANLLNYRKTTT